MTNQEMKLAKVKKSCRVAKIVTRVVAIINCIGAALCGIGAVACMAAKDAVNQFIAANPDAINGELETNGLISLSKDLNEMAAEGVAAQGMAAFLAIALLGCAFIAVVFFMLSKVFVRMQTSESPFDPALMSTLKKTFIFVAIVMILFVDTVPAILMAILLWCIYTIIDYGCTLQQEVDDTI